jgi:hypothetical protein
VKGELEPVVMIPRFTSYLGEGTYTTIPMEVSSFRRATLEFWRGTLVGTAGQTTFAAHFEQASEADPPGGWSAIVSSITTPNDSDLLDLEFSKAYFRIRIVLATDDVNNLAAITCWAAGSLERRVPPGAGAP